MKEQDIKEFMEKFGFDYVGPPRHLPDPLSHTRIELLKEELREYLRAVESGALVDQFDALIDLVYVAIGNAHLHGFNFRAGWEAVHDANMKKVRGVSKRGLPYDVCKPEGWTPPDLEGILYASQGDQGPATKESGND